MRRKHGLHGEATAGAGPRRAACRGQGSRVRRARATSPRSPPGSRWHPVRSPSSQQPARRPALRWTKPSPSPQHLARVGQRWSAPPARRDERLGRRRPAVRQPGSGRPGCLQPGSWRPPGTGHRGHAVVSTRRAESVQLGQRGSSGRRDHGHRASYALGVLRPRHLSRGGLNRDHADRVGRHVVQLAGEPCPFRADRSSCGIDQLGLACDGSGARVALSVPRHPGPRVRRWQRQP